MSMSHVKMPREKARVAPFLGAFFMLVGVASDVVKYVAYHGEDAFLIHVGHDARRLTSLRAIAYISQRLAVREGIGVIDVNRENVFFRDDGWVKEIGGDEDVPDEAVVAAGGEDAVQVVMLDHILKGWIVGGFFEGIEFVRR